MKKENETIIVQDKNGVAKLLYPVKMTLAEAEKIQAKPSIEEVMLKSNEKLKEISGRTKEYNNEERIKLVNELFEYNLGLFEEAFPGIISDVNGRDDEEKYPGITKLQKHLVANDEILQDELDEGIENKCKSDTLVSVVNKRANATVCRCTTPEQICNACYDAKVLLRTGNIGPVTIGSIGPVTIKREHANICVLAYRGSWFPEHGIEVFFFKNMDKAAEFMMSNYNSGNHVGYRVVEND